MAESGLLTAVRWEWDGTELTSDAAVNATQVIVKDQFTLFPDRVIYIGGTGPYTITGIVDTTVTLSPPLLVAMEDGEPVVPDSGGGPGKVWIAEVLLLDAEEPIEVMLVTKDLTVLPEGEYDPPKAILLSDDLERVLDTPGSTPILDEPLPSLMNSSMEDPYVDPIVGTVDWNSFAGWRRGDATAAGGTLQQHIDTPISGTRSLRIVLAGQNDGQRVITRNPTPVSSGQIWNLSAKFRTTRTIDKGLGTSGEALLSLIAHTSDGTIDPESPIGTSVVWTTISSVDAAVSGIVLTLAGTVQIPAGHRLMKVSFLASPALTGGGYSVDVDEVIAQPAVREIRIVNAAGEVTTSVSEEGDATFHDLIATGAVILQPAMTFLDGAALSDVLADSARGVIAAGARDPAVSGITSEYAVYQMEFQVPETRACRITTTWATTNSLADGRNRGRLRHLFSATGPVVAIGTSTVLDEWFVFGGPTVNQRSEYQYSTSVDLSAGWHSLRFSLNALGGTIGPGGTTDTIEDVRMSVEDIGLPSLGTNLAYKPASPGTLSTSGTDGGSTAPPQTQTYTKTYNANASRWYNGNGNQKSGQDPDFNNVGNTPTSADGNRRSAFWFNDGAIRNDLAGAEVTKAEIYLYFESGGNDKTVVIGTHGDSAQSSDWGLIGGKVADQVRSANWDSGSGRWVSLPASLDGWRTGARRGIIIGPGVTDSATYAGAIKGVNLSVRPILRITYKK
jgi:hypothetical protein